MRMKSTPLWEQHIEKAVFAVLLILLLALLVMQFIGSPNSVDVRISGANKTLAPGELNDELITAAELIRTRQGENAPPMDDPPSIDSIRLISPQVGSMISGDLMADGSVRRGAPVLASALLTSGSSSSEPFYEPSPPSLAMMSVQSFLDEVTSEVVAENEELDRKLEPGSNEITWLTPVATINMSSSRSEFEQAPDGLVTAPPHWRNGMYMIVDVQFERQELGVDGAWGDPLMLAPFFATQASRRSELIEYAGGITLMGDDEQEVAQDELRTMLIDTYSKPRLQRELLQPYFVDTKFGAATQFLTDPMGGAGDDRDVKIIEREIKIIKQQQRQDKLSAELDALGGPLADEERPGRDDDGGGRGGRGGNGGGGKGGGLGGGGKTVDGNKDSAQDERTKRQRRSRTRQLNDLGDEIDRMLEELAKIAPDSDLLNTDGAEKVASELDLLNDDVVVTWTHDIDVESGRTYRYRASASFYSPFFARGFQLDAEQEVLGMRPSIETVTGNWGEAVTVDSGTEFFFTAARPGSDAMIGEAVVEVFSQQNGRYWSETYTVRPGDQIGTERRVGGGGTVDFGTGWFVVDIIPSGLDAKGDSIFEVIVQEIGGDEQVLVRKPESESDSSQFKAMELKVKNAEALQGQASASEGNG